MQYIMYWFSYAFINNLDGNITVYKSKHNYIRACVCVCVIVTPEKLLGLET